MKKTANDPKDVTQTAANPEEAEEPLAEKVGNATVRIYRSQSGDHEYFQVPDFTTGKRRLLTFSTEALARAKAHDIAKNLNKGQVEVLKLTDADVAAYRRAVQLLEPTGVALELAAAEFAEAKARLGKRSLAEAVNFFLRHCPASMPSKTVTEVVNELVAAKEADGASEIYLKDLNFRLGKLKERFHTQITDLTAGDLNVFLRELKGSGRGRNNYRNAIGTLIKFAETSGYITKNHLDFTAVARAKELHTEISIFRAKEMSALLTAAQLNPKDLKPGYNLRYAEGQGLLPFLVLGGFAGLRTAEIERQGWEEINLERGFIRVTSAKGNTAQKRLVPISKNLRQWLSICVRDSGPVCEIARTPAALTRLAARAGVKWKHNALRHSYASYRMAEIKNAAQVSLELGNSPKMVFRHYRELVTEDEAKTWFSLKPGKDGKIILFTPETKPVKKAKRKSKPGKKTTVSAGAATA